MKRNTARLAALALACAVATAASAAEQPSYSPYAGRSFPERLRWGATPLHTNLSAAAGSFGNPSGCARPCARATPPCSPPRPAGAGPTSSPGAGAPTRRC